MIFIKANIKRKKSGGNDKVYGGKMVECDKCGKRIGFGERNPFIDEQEKDVVLCTDCYFFLSKNEKKKLVHTGKQFREGKYKPTGLIFGLVGSVGYSEGQNSGAHWVLNRRKNKTEYTQKQIDEISIDMFNAHWNFLTVEAKQELLKEIEKKKKKSHKQMTYFS